MQALPHSPAADRNKEPILAQLAGILGERGTALEIASGTGQPTMRPACDDRKSEWRPVRGWVRTSGWRTGAKSCSS